jgi:hypothetical protein
MKVGMIFECGKEGADKKVCEYLAQKLLPDIEISSITLTNKPKLLRECGEQTAMLLKEGCEQVLIIWDLYPPWREHNEKPCRKEDRERIFSSLKEAGVTSPNVYLICIREELEAWLIADGRALSTVLSTPAHPVKIKDTKKPDNVKNPKGKLRKIFKETIGRDYNDMVHAEKIVRELPDMKKRSPSFVRFAAKLTGDE